MYNEVKTKPTSQGVSRNNIDPVESEVGITALRNELQESSLIDKPDVVTAMAELSKIVVATVVALSTTIPHHGLQPRLSSSSPMKQEASNSDIIEMDFTDTTGRHDSSGQ